MVLNTKRLSAPNTYTFGPYSPTSGLGNHDTYSKHWDRLLLVQNPNTETSSGPKCTKEYYDCWSKSLGVDYWSLLLLKINSRSPMILIIWIFWLKNKFIDLCLKKIQSKPNIYLTDTLHYPVPGLENNPVPGSSTWNSCNVLWDSIGPLLTKNNHRPPNDKQSKISCR